MSLNGGGDMKLTFKEVIKLGFTEVIVQADGYQEGRVLSTWQPFRHRRDITFKIIPLGKNDGYLEHKTFILKDNEDDLDYYWNTEDNKIYVKDAEIMADIDY